MNVVCVIKNSSSQSCPITQGLLQDHYPYNGDDGHCHHHRHHRHPKLWVRREALQQRMPDDAEKLR